MYEPYANPLASAPALAAHASYAGWLRRVAASLIDALVLMGSLFVGFVILGFAEDLTGGPANAVAGVVMASFLLAIFFYDPICHAVWEQTVGKRAMGIKLVMDSGERVGFGRSLWRHLAKVVLAVIPILGLLDALNPLASKKNQTVHDSIASTVVVEASAS